MKTIAFIGGLLLILATLLDGFETILLPRRINHRFRYSRIYYRNFWRVWRSIASHVFKGRWREAMLSVFGPMSLLGLFSSWIICLILGFTALQWSLGSLMPSNELAPYPHTFASYLYFSGTTYFTLGLGDVVPRPGWPRALTVMESGVGFGFLAIIISYLPVLYQGFSRREVTISLMDSRAGSPPTGGEFLRRSKRDGHIDASNSILLEWERWCAELLESHLSFPVLAYYRSQHANQSWLAALTAMLDSCALLLTVLPADQTQQAQLTFAMARHAAVDITLIFGLRPPDPKRVPARGVRAQFTIMLEKMGRRPEEFPGLESRFAELRALYEPFIDSLAHHFVLTLPPVAPTVHIDDNWQRSAWMSSTPGIGALSGRTGADHFD